MVCVSPCYAKQSVQQHRREKRTSPGMGSAQGAVGKSTLGLCSVEEGWSGYSGCKVYSLSVVLFYNLLFEQLFHYTIGPFSLRPTKNFALSYTSLLPPSSQEENTLIAPFPSCRPVQTLTLSPPCLHSYNSVTIILLIFTFIFSC